MTRVGEPRDPFKDPRADLEERKAEYLASILAKNDDDGPAKRRGYLRRTFDAPNPEPGKLRSLNKKLESKAPNYMTGEPRHPVMPSYEYEYLSAEDINMSLARLYSREPVARVFPSHERPPNSPKSAPYWVDIPENLRKLPPLTETARAPMLLAIVQLLHHDLRTFLKDTILLPALTVSKDDDKDGRDKDRIAYCDPVIIDLYERWTPQGYPEDQRAMLEEAIGEFSLPGTKPLSASEPARLPDFPPPPALGQPAGGSVGEAPAGGPPAGPVTISPADYYPRMGGRWAAHFASGFMLLTPPTGAMLLERSRQLSPNNVLTPKLLEAWEWIALIGALTHEKLGESLRQIAEKLVNDSRFDPAAREKFWPEKLNHGFLAEIPSNPFIWSVRTQRPKVTVPPDFQYPDFTEQGLYWWRVLFSHCIKHMLALRDTSDFHATDLLRFSYALKIFDPSPRANVPGYVLAMIRSTLLNFKYWYDETPSGDFDAEGGPDEEMCFWSENHQFLFAQSAYLAGALFPTDQFQRSHSSRKFTGREQSDRGRKRAEWWLDNRLKFGFSEWNSPGYYNEDINPLLNVAEFAPDSTMREKAAMVMDLIMFDFARWTCSGSFAVTAGRSYREHKFTGWDQSVGDLIEIAFGTRGDYVETPQNCAVAFATSDYEVPDAILGIGLDRYHMDRSPGAAPFVDRSRVSTVMGDSDAPRPDTPEGVLFWWGNNNYLTEEMRENTRREVDAHPNLSRTAPFSMLNPGKGLLGALAKILLAIAKIPGLSQLLECYAGSGLQGAGWRAGALLPFPLNVMAWGTGAAGTVLMIRSLVKLFMIILNLAKRFFDWAFKWTGLTDTDDEPEFPESDLIAFYHALLDTFSRGSVLQRANLYTYSNGHAMLSSVINHQPGAIAAQKQPWMASLGCDASVWTTCPWPEKALLETLFRWKTIGNLQEATTILFENMLEPYRAIFGLARPLMPNFFGDVGPNDWTGSFALPFVVQHENVAAILYDMPLEQRASVDNGTHAWFPTYLFDEVVGPEGADDDAKWIFGRKEQGFVALYSAQGMEWEGEEDERAREAIWASGARNVWICIVGRAASPMSVNADFSRFCKDARDSKPEVHHLSGANAAGDLRGKVRVPKAGTKPDDWPWLEFNYDDRKASIGGAGIALETYPRFENRYVSLNGEPPAPGQSGTVPWGARQYFIHHPKTRSWVSHDHVSGMRRRSEDEPKFTLALPGRKTAAVPRRALARRFSR